MRSSKAPKDHICHHAHRDEEVCCIDVHPSEGVYDRTTPEQEHAGHDQVCCKRKCREDEMRGVSVPCMDDLKRRPRSVVVSTCGAILIAIRPGFTAREAVLNSSGVVVRKEV